jgi:uncharacterized repeat protein (TIGR03803 family)
MRLRTGYKVLHTFTDKPDGAYSNAGLLASDGVFYGTTANGGDDYYGTVFSVDPSGAETILHSFAGGSSDGAHPGANLIDVKGTLYSTTYEGGPDGYGTVFAIDTKTRKEWVVHSFTGGSDGDDPAAPMLRLGNLLYGTTLVGGQYGDGTVFATTTSGTEIILHTFGASSDDGAQPRGSLIAVSGTIYSTTYYGGAYDKGTVFSITASGTERIVYSFGASSSDGAYPRAGLTLLNGALFGTTYQGGSNNYGTVFELTPSGGETVIHSFTGEPDGANPGAVMIVRRGALYGTTYDGGVPNSCPIYGGCGTIFKITPAGHETVLYRFKGAAGDGPWGGVIAFKDELYGTASLSDKGYGFGDVFRLSP